MTIDIMTADELRERLSDRVVTIVAERVGISAMTIYRLIKEEYEPSLETRLKLTDYFRKHF